MADVTQQGGGGNSHLSIKAEELQALINEVRQLREENIEIFQELTKQNMVLNL